ncbi:prolipoprotein diacylglyceryl transferase [Propionibacterium freudenreichii]|uniref:prolipoprotein diacylglyceryl transferase n=1 Tax=Propionibacterium freudenreichii TaxID=1744 RepID=UPI00049F1CF7|nr:prolipoprotein diacylglyceryl transferase [Propionibacterium freudenreichii]AJQ90721.1 Prolipoprotein diacylglyceryl transferase [Propionibacterium freudenreichii subsp. freudenreichii]AWY95740.1 Prolipoprotein diacylglyceryl transferase [Propionibacterium freudenreichii]MDK9330794.1 prolipoprotein diacylglyceryl transferase [Propionibacterium freudenreichii]MDK9662507.1 prolipoprotein diacylglyceryl transferase [Propionibacterium freudenreichii]CDP48642.1 Prolipoprotein diacylglyceryl tran
MSPLFIPSPPISSFSLGPLTIHFYALCILAGIVVAAVLGNRRLARQGATREQFESMLLWVVVIGIIGARAYHVITDHELYFGPGRHPIDALKIWNGGLGIWGGVAAGALTAWVWCRRNGMRFGVVADALAPAVIFAQALGRLGNWFNQELFGRPTTLPWGLLIDPEHRPVGYEQFATFHPTFLYELIWDVLGGFLLLWLGRRFAMGRGKLFTCYVMYYCLGRFFIEALRIDPANTIGGFRINNYTSAIVFVLATILFIWQLRFRPGNAPDVWRASPDMAVPTGDHPAGPAPIADDAPTQVSPGPDASGSGTHVPNVPRGESFN